MEIQQSQHDEAIEVEEAALEAGFTGSEVQEVSPKVEEQPKEEAIQEDRQQDRQEVEKKDDEGEDKPLTRADLQALLDRNAALESQLTKVHDKAFGKIGELQQKIERLKGAGTKISPKAKERLADEFPELASMLFDGVEDDAPEPAPNQNPPYKGPSVDELVESRTKELEKNFEKKLLKQSHPDWEEIVQTKDFSEWAAALPPQEQSEISNSWDSIYLTKKFNEFKKWRTGQEEKSAAKKTKDEDLKRRLESAIQPKGSPKGLADLDDDDEASAMERAFSG